MDIVFFLYLLLLFLTLYILSNHFLHKLRKLPPSPFPCLPLIGHLYLLKSPFHEALYQVSKRYGSVVSLQLGSRPILLVSSPSIIDECLRKNDIVFANRPHFLFGKYFGYNYTSMAWSSYGEHWRNLRKISIVELLSCQSIQMLAHVRIEEVHKLIVKLYKSSLENPNKIVDMKATLFELTYNIMTRMIMGRIYYGEKVTSLEEAKSFEEIVKSTANIKEKASLLDFLPLMRFFGLKNVEPKLKDIQMKRDEFMQRLVEEHRRTMSNDGNESKKRKSVIEVLLDLHEKDPEYYNDELIRNLILVRNIYICVIITI
ncbi:oxygenase [Lithospermum erythrorhizon]|uniref:Oxygenase n=1 Tax=Lithospermum erythrorhizon TaxID=34254 RepID=A0AAV3Q5Z4_LITER